VQIRFAVVLALIFRLSSTLPYIFYLKHLHQSFATDNPNMFACVWQIPTYVVRFGIFDDFRRVQLNCVTSGCGKFSFSQNRSPLKNLHEYPPCTTTAPSNVTAGPNAGRTMRLSHKIILGFIK
jgi:hypothetical protein